jgi:hypothetical protein
MMAKHIAEVLEKRPNDLVLAAGGMNHMWKYRFNPGGQNHTPQSGIGCYLERDGLKVTSLKMTTNGGTQWQCGGGKCIHEYREVYECFHHYPAASECIFESKDEGPGRHMSLYQHPHDGFEGELYLGRVHASEPAAEPPPGGWQTPNVVPPPRTGSPVPDRPNVVPPPGTGSPGSARSTEPPLRRAPRDLSRSAPSHRLHPWLARRTWVPAVWRIRTVRSAPSRCG